MADVNVISVNPGKKTLGALNIDLISKVARSCRPVSRAIRTPRFKTVCNVVFGINKSVTPSWSSKLWLSRSVVSAYFLITGIIGISASTGNALHALSIFNIVAACMIFLGFLSRIASASGFMLYAAIAVSAAFGYSWHLSSATTPVFESMAVMQAIMYLLIAVTGPGRYSIDQLLRRYIFRKAKRRAILRARHAAENRMSYKAWREADA